MNFAQSICKLHKTKQKIEGMSTKENDYNVTVKLIKTENPRIKKKN